MVPIYLTTGFLLAYGVFVTVLAAQWNQLYFEKGIPVYSKSIPFNEHKRASIKINSFINNIDSYKGFFRYTGKTIDENTFYFRKKMIQVGRTLTDTGNIHGAIIIDNENRVVKIKGRESFSIILLLAVPFPFSVSPGFGITKAIEALIAIIIILLISFAFSRHRYKQLFKIITELIEENK